MKSKSPCLFGICRQHLYILFGVWLIVHIFLFYRFGIQDSFVDSQRYIAMGDHLLTEGNLEESFQVFYLIPVFVLALCRILFTDGVVAFVILQSMLSVLAAIALYKSAEKLYGSAGAGLFAALIYLLWIDSMQWNTAVMTESLAASLICMLIYSVTHFNGSRKDYVLLFLLTFLCILTRPTGVVIVTGSVIFLLTRHWPWLAARPLLKYAWLFVLAIVAFCGAYLMLNEWDFTDQYVRGNIVTYMDTIEGRPYYSDALRLDTSGLTLPDAGREPFEKIVLFVYHNPLHFIHAAALKVLYLISGVRPYFSFFHNFYTVVWLTCVYALFYWGLRNTKDKAVRNFCIAIVIANCLLVSVSAVDWDKRFFLPMQPGIVLLAAGGGSFYFRSLSARFLP